MHWTTAYYLAPLALEESPLEALSAPAPLRAANLVAVQAQEHGL
jgi:hypothetical protein